MLLPDSIPCAISDRTGPSAPTAGNGWEVKVLAHCDFHTEICQLPDYLSLQFSKILKDKGAGTIVLSLDDPVLFPPGVTSLNANADFSAGVSGWSASGGTRTLVQPGPPGGPLPNSFLFVPAGNTQNAYIQGNGNQVQAVPGQRYTVRTTVFPTTASQHVLAGIVFLDMFGNKTVVVSVSQAAASGSWQAYGATVTAPGDAVVGWPCVGLGSSPGQAMSLYVAGIETSYESMQATTLQQSATRKFAPLQDLPPGSVTLGDYLLDYEHLWQIYRDGVLVFDFTGQSVTEQKVDESEQRTATVTGPGTVGVLGWARAMPPGFPSIIFKTDAIQDGFAEIDTNGNPLLDTNIWNAAGPLDHITLSPPGTCQISASVPNNNVNNGNGTALAAKTYDLTSSSISAQITAPASTVGGKLDGSQATRFIVRGTSSANNYAAFLLTSSQFLAQISDITGGGSSGGSPAIVPTLATKDLGKYSATGDLYWRISEQDGQIYFWTSADGQNWVRQFHGGYGWDATSVIVEFALAYDADAAAAMGVSNLNGDIITPSSAGNIFLDKPIMSIWLQLFADAQARGTIPWVRTRMSAVADSFGNPWADAMSVQIQNGTDLYSMLQAHAGITNADWIMQPGFELQVGLPLQDGGAVSLGVDRTHSVVLREAAQLTQRSRVRARDQVQNSFGAVNSDGTVVSASDSLSISRYHQREGWAETAAQVNPPSMQVVVQASLDQLKDEVTSETIQVLPHQAGATPLSDFDVGDWIGRERTGAFSSYTDPIRVVGISFSVDATGLVSAELTVNTYRQWLQQQLQYLVDKFGGQFINAVGTVPVTSTGTPGTVPTVISPGLGGLTDVEIGTDDLDPLVFSAEAGVWQNCSNPNPTGSPIGLAVGPSSGPKASLVPPNGQTLSVDGSGSWSFLSAFQGPSAATTETMPTGMIPLINHQGAANEQLGLLMSAGMNGQQTYAILLTATSADGTTGGHARIGKLSPGSGVTWAFNTIQTYT